MHLDVKKTPFNICTININKLIFWHLNLNSLRNIFYYISELFKGTIDFLMVSGTKLDDIFLEGQFLVESSHLPFTFDRNKYGGVLILHAREDIPAE